MFNLEKLKQLQLNKKTDQELMDELRKIYDTSLSGLLKSMNGSIKKNILE